eukprot:scaffold2015_cov186-Amphora_coffeaeformis.AAC.7
MRAFLPGTGAAFLACTGFLMDGVHFTGTDFFVGAALAGALRRGTDLAAARRDAVAPRRPNGMVQSAKQQFGKSICSVRTKWKSESCEVPVGRGLQPDVH